MNTSLDLLKKLNVANEDQMKEQARATMASRYGPVKGFLIARLIDVAANHYWVIRDDLMCSKKVFLNNLFLP